MNESTTPDLTQFTETKTVVSCDANLFNEQLKDGWTLIAVGISRGKVWHDGTFEDDFKALFGR